MTAIKIIPTTDQEAFDMVTWHLATIKERSVNYAGSCVYRGPGNSKCAVGVMIRDEDYDPRIDTGFGDDDAPGTGIDDLVGYGHIDIGEVQNLLLADLQGIHDDRALWDKDGFKGWGQLRSTALRYGLNTSKLPS